MLFLYLLKKIQIFEILFTKKTFSMNRFLGSSNMLIQNYRQFPLIVVVLCSDLPTLLWIVQGYIMNLIFFIIRGYKLTTYIYSQLLDRIGYINLGIYITSIRYKNLQFNKCFKYPEILVVIVKNFNICCNFYI